MLESSPDAEMAVPAEPSTSPALAPPPDDAEAALAAGEPALFPTALVPRLYQLELLEMAKARNVIAFLDTGSGKTLVSVLLIAHCLEQQRQQVARAAAEQVTAAQAGGPPPSADPDLPAGDSEGQGAGQQAEGPDLACCEGASAEQPEHRVAVFLAPKVALVLQQAEVLRCHLRHCMGGSKSGDDDSGHAPPPRVGQYVGGEASDLRHKDRWQAIFRGHDVLVMTPQILLNLLTHGIVALSQLCLLVFDECHHAQKRHPYARIMAEHYHVAPEGAPRPRVFGLTSALASVRLGQGQSWLEQHMRELEANLDAKVVTVGSREEVERVAPPPKLKVCEYAPLACLPLGAAPDPMAALDAHLSRARCRLQCAGDNFELEWLGKLQSALGTDGVSQGAQRVYFDPVGPGLTAACLEQMLSGVQHVLQTLGPYCAALCAAEVFRSLTSLAPAACAFVSLPDGTADEGGSEQEQGAGASRPAGGGLSEEGQGHGQAPACPLPAADMAAEVCSAAQAELRRRQEELALKVLVSGFSRGEVESEQRAASLSACDVLQAFATLFTHDASHCFGDLRCQLAELLADARTRARHGKALQDLPYRGMQLILASIAPGQLQAAVGAVTSAAAPAPPSFPLISPKAGALVAQLLLHRRQALGEVAGLDPGTGAAPAGASWSAIVFVQQRMAAWALHSLLSTIPATAAFLRTSAIMGHGRGIGTTERYGEQSQILRRFRHGELNLLVSTSVAEEGIDVRSCQLVVRFDLPADARSYVQSRGRARMAHSELLLMIEQGSHDQYACVQHMVAYEQQLRRESQAAVPARMRQEAAMGEDCASLAWRIRAAQNAAAERAMVYETSAGARLESTNAQLLLNHYVSHLPGDRYTTLRPLYRTEELDSGGFRTRAFLPSNSPLLIADGLTCPTRRTAIASAAFEACKRLHQMGALNDNLLSAELEEPHTAPRRRKAAAGRSPSAPRPNVVGRKRLAETDGLLRNKPPKVLPPVVLEPAPSPLLAGQQLRALLARAEESGQPATLHCFRWEVALPQAADGDGPAAGCQPGDAAGGDEQLRQLLRGLQRLALLLPAPPPQQLPACTLALPHTDNEDANCAGPRIDNAPLLQVRLVSAGTLLVSPERLHQMLACSSVLMQHMFSRGACGTAGQLLDSAGTPQAAGPASSTAVASGTGKGSPNGDGAGAGTAAGAEGGEDEVWSRPRKRARVDEGPAQEQVEEARAVDSEHVEAAAAAAQLVSNALHRMLLLHDGRGLPGRQQERNRTAKLQVPPAPDAGFVVVPLDGPSSGASAGVAIDWVTASDIADLAASGESSAWQLMHAVAQATGVPTGQPAAAQADAPTPAPNELEVQRVCRPAVPAHAPVVHDAAASASAVEEWKRLLEGRVLVTSYNGASYLFRDLAQGLSLDSTFEVAELEYVAKKRAKLAATAEAAKAGGAAGAGPMDAEGDAGDGGFTPAAGTEGGPIGDGSAEQDSGAEGEGEAPVTPQVISYRQYYADRWQCRDLDTRQPLLLAARVPRQQLAAGLGGAGTRKRASLALRLDEDVRLVPQLCAVHPVPVWLWRSLASLPPLLWQLEAALQAQELLARLMPPGLPPDRLPPLELVRSALTARSALETYDYERLETLGDAHLKFAVSVQLFVRHRTYHEGQLTKRKELVVSNTHLADKARELGLDRLLRVLPFSLRNWASPRAKNSKVLADAMEALLGAFLVAGGDAGATALLTHLGLLPGGWQPVYAESCCQPPERDSVTSAGGMAEACDEPVASTAGPVTDVAAIEVVLGYRFRHPWLVAEALTHCSWPGSGHHCYQRLEFLGDAVLDAAVTRHFFSEHEGCSPSAMHDMRSVAVNAERLAFAAVAHGLQRHIRHQSPRLQTHVQEFQAEWEAKVAEARQGSPAATAAAAAAQGQPETAGADDLGAVAGGSAGLGSGAEPMVTDTAEPASGSSRAGGAAAPVTPGAAPQQYLRSLEEAQRLVLSEYAFGFQSIQAPKVLSDVVESLIGAVYVDSGGSLDTAWAVVRRLLAPLPTPDTTPQHPIRELQELVQRFGCNPRYEEVGRAGGTVHVHVTARGVLLGESNQASNFRAACHLAAKDAIKAWASGPQAALAEATEAAAAAKATDAVAKAEGAAVAEVMRDLLSSVMEAAAKSWGEAA